MKVKIDDQLVSCGLVMDGDNLNIGLIGISDLGSVYQNFTPSSMPQVMVYDDNDELIAIYANRKVTGVYWSNDNIQVSMQVDPVEISELDRVMEALNEQSENSTVNEDAIAELAEIIADMDSRIEVMEENIQQLFELIPHD